MKFLYNNGVFPQCFHAGQLLLAILNLARVIGFHEDCGSANNVLVT